MITPTPQPRTRWFIVIGVMVFGIAVLVLPRQPRYQGRSLRAWICDLDSKGVAELARAAIKSMGEAALPYVLDWGAAGDSRLRRPLQSWRDAPDFIKRILPPDSFHPYYRRSGRLAEAFAALGPVRSNAIPRLTTLLSGPDPEKSVFAARCLASLANERPETLRIVLTHQDANVREIALNTLSRYGPVSASEMPLVTACLHDPSALVRNQAARYVDHFLAEFKAHSPGLVEDFRRRLREESTEAQTMSRDILERIMTMVGELGAEAEAALPDLYVLQNCSDSRIRQYATTIIQVIKKKRTSINQ